MMRPAGIEAVRAEIARACRDAGREADSVTLVAVAKTYGPDAVEPVDRRRATRCSARTGCRRRRRNGRRSGRATAASNCISSARCSRTRRGMRSPCSMRSIRSTATSLAAALAKEIARQGRRLLLFAEVNIGDEPQKAGVAPQEMDAFLAACRDRHGLAISGLMCIPPDGEAPAPLFCADRQDRSAQWAEAALDGDERGLPDGDRVRCHPYPGRHGDFRRAEVIGLICKSQFVVFVANLAQQ